MICIVNCPQCKKLAPQKYWNGQNWICQECIADVYCFSCNGMKIECKTNQQCLDYYKRENN